MAFSSKSAPVIGLDIGTHSIKLIKLKKTGSRYALENFAVMPLPQDAIVDGIIQDHNAVISALKNLVKMENIKTKNVVTGIAGESVVIKKINLPVMSDEELAESIKIEAEQYIPFDIDDVNIDFQIVNSSSDTARQEANEADGEHNEENQMDVLLVAAKKETIEERTSIITEAGLKPLVVDVDVFALENGYELNHADFNEEGVLALVDIGAGMTNINIMEDGVTTFTKDIPIGGLYFNQMIQDELNVTNEVAENLKMGIESEGFSTKEVIPIILSSADAIIQEINKTFEFYGTAANRDVDMVSLSGGTASIIGFDKLIEKNLDTPVELFDPFKNIKINYKKFDPEYIDSMKHCASVCTGLAIRRFYDK